MNQKILIELIVRIAEYLDHSNSCNQTARSQPEHGCTCGLDQLIEDIDLADSLTE